jgi:choline transport protein
MLPRMNQHTDVCSFCITDLEAVLGGGDFPIIEIIHHATGSYAATCVLGGLLVLLLFFSTVTTVASASRQLWAFSRDRGFPFSSWICHVRPEWEIPANAVSLDPCSQPH